MERKFKVIADERQKQQTYYLEHLQFWVVFWLLAISVLIQVILLKAPLSQIAAELIILTIACTFNMAAFIYTGIWSLYCKATQKSYLLSATLSSAVCVFIYWFMLGGPNKIRNICISAIAVFTLTYLLCFALGTAIQKRHKKLESTFDDSEDSKSQ